MPSSLAFIPLTERLAPGLTSASCLLPHPSIAPCESGGHLRVLISFGPRSDANQPSHLERLCKVEGPAGKSHSAVGLRTSPALGRSSLCPLVQRSGRHALSIRQTERLHPRLQ